jgi:hypothetical protein
MQDAGASLEATRRVDLCFVYPPAMHLRPQPLEQSDELEPGAVHEDVHWLLADESSFRGSLAQRHTAIDELRIASRRLGSRGRGAEVAGVSRSDFSPALWGTPALLPAS